MDNLPRPDGVAQKHIHQARGSVLSRWPFGLFGLGILLALALSWVTFWSPKAETILDGEPRVIVRDGRIVQENLHRDRLTRAEILSEMRLAGIGRLSDVAWAILEPQGKMSFIKREAARTDDSQPKNQDDNKAA